MQFHTILFSLLVAGSSAFAPQSLSIAKSSSSNSALHLAVGDVAPDFALTDQNGKTFTRSSVKKPLVVYFYPADSTPGCTKQAQGFNTELKAIRAQGADVVGISKQGADSKIKFASELDLNFSLLADEDDAVRTAFAVPKAAFGLFPGRVTYVLDGKGVCQKIYNDLGDAAGHVAFAKEALEEMKPVKKSLFGR